MVGLRLSGSDPRSAPHAQGRACCQACPRQHGPPRLLARLALVGALGVLLSELSPRGEPEGAKIPHPDSWTNWGRLANEALEKASKLMDEDIGQVLQAEAVLAQVLERMRASNPGARATAAVQAVQEAPVFREVLKRSRQYDSVREVLEPLDFKLSWEQDEAGMWIHHPPGASFFEYRLVANIAAPLRHCLVPLHERDLILKYQPVFKEPHRELSSHRTRRSSRHYAVVRTLSQLLGFYVETVFELLRVSNRDFGFLTERVESDFPTEHCNIPNRSWWCRRVAVDTKNLWLPAGGTSNSTVLVSVSRVQVGVPIPDYVLNWLAHQFSMSVLRNVRRGTELVMEAGSPWNTRLKEDGDGFYRELEQVEAAAARRKEVSIHSLPGTEVFDRPWRLQSPKAEPA